MRNKVLFLFVLFNLTACSPPEETPFSSRKDEILSSRSPNIKQFIAILKLKVPPLFATAKRINGKTYIRNAQRIMIQREQEETIKHLQSLSKEIKTIYRYRFVLNGLAVLAPKNLEETLKKMYQLSYFETEQWFDPPVVEKVLAGSDPFDLSKNNSVSHIQAQKVRETLTVLDKNGKPVPVDGRGVKIGIIDTGIDYTHKMFTGPGTEAAFKSIDPDKPSKLFPNKKVVGGIDLVGEAYDAGSPVFKDHIPIPDQNPIDQRGHGSHVAGTVAGIGDNVNTYSGVAPGADLYAIKVFGAGSVGDSVVIAAFEYAADPNKDLDPSDQLDVVNLSLGSAFGKPHILYQEAVQNLTHGGTSVVASAGNNGPIDHIVGSPGASTDALSVAASIDSTAHNWIFDAVKLSAVGFSDIYVKATEGPISKPINEAGNVFGKLVYIGLADMDLPPAEAAKLEGNIALIDRGVTTFVSKLKIAYNAGAIGAIVANNRPGEAIIMGGDEVTPIPAIFITQAEGDSIKNLMATVDVTCYFQTTQKIKTPELIDTLTSFSSKGPRSTDSFFKPEISAPGYRIISADIGTGVKGVKFNGTSMASPHVAGVMGLLRQYHPTLSTQSLKSLVMSSGLTISDKDGVVYPLSRQGAGRVQTYNAALTPVVFHPPALSLGEVMVDSSANVEGTLWIRNITNQKLVLDITTSTDADLVLKSRNQITIKPYAWKKLSLYGFIAANKNNERISELDGYIIFSNKGKIVARTPALAIAHQVSRIHPTTIKRSKTDLELTLENEGDFAGNVLAFNNLGWDAPRKGNGSWPWMASAEARFCDLQLAGHRLIKKEIDGVETTLLQFGVKVYQPLTTWESCEISVLIDGDDDKIADQELAGIVPAALPGLSDEMTSYYSILLDAATVRKARLDFEEALETAPDPSQVGESYASAIVDVQGMDNYNYSTISVVSADINKLVKDKNNTIKIRLAVLSKERNVHESDDFLSWKYSDWKTLSLDSKKHGYYGMKETISVDGNESSKVDIKKGDGNNKLLLLFPDNSPSAKLPLQSGVY